MIHYRFYSQPISKKARVSEKKFSQYKFDILYENSKLLEQLERPTDIINSRFEQGAVCIAAKKDEIFIGCIWLIKEQYTEDEVRAVYHFPSNSIWDFDVYVIPKKRLTPAFAALWDKADLWMSSQYIENTLSRISAYNSSSIRSHTSGGATKIGWMITICGNSSQLTLCSLRPFIHYSASKNNLGPNLKFRHF